MYANGADLEIPRDSMGGPWGLPGAPWEAPGAAWGVLGGPLGSPRAPTGVHKVLFKIIKKQFVFIVYLRYGRPQGVPRGSPGASWEHPWTLQRHRRDTSTLRACFIYVLGSPRGEGGGQSQADPKGPPPFWATTGGLSHPLETLLEPSDTYTKLHRVRLVPRL